MLNSLNIVGRICNDIELRTTQGGNQITNFSVAVDRDYQSNGEKQTDFFSVVAFGNTAAFLERNFGKGQMIAVNGKMQSRKYEDKNGYNRIMWEMIAEHVYFCGDRKPESKSNLNVSAADFQESQDDDGDLPF